MWTHRGLGLVVSQDISVEGTYEDHAHHGREKDRDEDRVDEAEPLDVALGNRTEDIVPA